MLEDTPGQEPTTETTDSAAEAPAGSGPPAKKATARKTAAKKTTAKKTAAKKTTPRKSTRSPAAGADATARVEAPAAEAPADQTPAAGAPAAEAPAAETPAAEAPAEQPAGSEEREQRAEAAPAKKTTTRRRTTKKAAAPRDGDQEQAATSGDGEPEQSDATGTALLFQPPDASQAPAKPRRSRQREAPADPAPAEQAPTASEEPAAADSAPDDAEPDTGEGGESGGRRRRRRGGRRRRKSGGEGESSEEGQDPQPQQSGEKAEGKPDDKDQPRKGASEKKSDRDADADADADEDGGESSSSRRRRRRRRSGDDGGGDGNDDPQNTVTKVRQGRTGEDQITSLSGSTRLEAKKQRRREGREAGRRRAPIVSEAEFLARRESVDRVMAIRQRDDLTQIAVLEDKVLVEHYVARESQTSLIGNVYVGRVQNVLPSMEAAFIDIGKGRNAVLYAGEVNWTALGHKDGQPRKIESVLSSGQTIMVQVTKDPVGHKGARLTSQISLAGRFLVYVPDGTNSGISRKLPDTERNRLKTLLKEIVPDGAGVIVRTAAEGASEDELTRDVERLTARWADIEKSAKKASSAQLLYGEPDLMLKVVRDLFTEDIARLVVQGGEAWETVRDYVTQVAPDLEQRLEKHDAGQDSGQADLFATYRIDEQIAKGLDRKVWLPSGGSLIIDRTEAMTVVDVNTGKFTGSGGNLEETVTKNNLEAAEEMVRQLRLRDIGGIIVIDFIDMVLESNRDLVLRRLVECLGRDRTRHQVAEVTSLGLVQMTRKRIGTGLLEAFSETCTHCQGRGLLLSEAPVEPSPADDEPRRSRRSRGGKGRGDSGGSSDAKQEPQQPARAPSPKDVAAMARPPKEEDAGSAEAEPSSEDGSGTEQATAPPAIDEPVTEPAEAVTEPAIEPVVEPGPVTEAPTPDGQPAEEPPADEPADDQSADETPADEPPGDDQPATTRPAVVTRTRRRSARRPAGPPASSSPATTPPPGAVGSVGEPPESGVVEPGTADSEPPAVSHVPVKKRGSRKR